MVILILIFFKNEIIKHLNILTVENINYHITTLNFKKIFTILHSLNVTKHL